MEAIPWLSAHGALRERDQARLPRWVRDGHWLCEQEPCIRHWVFSASSWLPEGSGLSGDEVKFTFREDSICSRPFCQVEALQAAWLALPTSHHLSRAADTLCWLLDHLRHGVCLSKSPLPLSIFLFSLISASHPAARQSSEKNPCTRPAQARPQSFNKSLGRDIPSPPNSLLATQPDSFLLFLQSNGNHACPRAFAPAVLPPAPFMIHFHLSFGSRH